MRVVVNLLLPIQTKQGCQEAATEGFLLPPTPKTVIFRTPEAPQLRCSAQQLVNRPTETTPKSPRGCRLYTASINSVDTDNCLVKGALI